MASGTRNGGQWTEARFSSFIKSALRAASRRWPPKYNVLSSAKRGKKVNGSSGRIAEHYECAECNGLFPAKQVQVDHVIPVINPSVGFVSWDDVIERMYCEADGFQVLCLSCHKNKTNAEKRKAKERRDNE